MTCVTQRIELIHNLHFLGIELCHLIMIPLLQITPIKILDLVFRVREHRFVSILVLIRGTPV